MTSPCTHGASQQPEIYNNGIMQVNCQTVKAEHILQLMVNTKAWKRWGSKSRVGWESS